MDQNFKITEKNMNKLDNEQRRKLLPAKDIIEKFNLQEGEVFADFGCGVGYFTIPAAEIVGESGNVFALDISDSMLEETLKRAKANNISNISTYKIQNNIIPLEKNSIDASLLAFVLHEITEHKKLLSEIHKVLKPYGKIIIIEWDKIVYPVGPPIENRIDKLSVINLLKETNFINTEEIQIGENYYSLLAQKNV